MGEYLADDGRMIGELPEGTHISDEYLVLDGEQQLTRRVLTVDEDDGDGGLVERVLDAWKHLQREEAIEESDAPPPPEPQAVPEGDSGEPH